VRFWPLVPWITSSSSLMVISLGRRQGSYSFLSLSGSTACSDFVSSAAACRSSSSLKREIALHVLAYSLRAGVRFLLQMFSVSLRLDVVRVIVGHTPYITIRTCLIFASAGNENLQYYCI
jgi:hypothetical protein